MSGDEFMIKPDVEKLEALAEFAAGAGHEINNPLATIIGRAQLLLKEEHDPQRRQMLLSIGAQAYRIRDMIGDAMLFGRPPRPEITDVELSKLIDHVVNRLADEMDEHRCTIQTEISPTIVVRADATQMAIVFSELLRNSQRALSPGGGPIRMTAEAQFENVLIQIFDQGTGFSEIEREHAFDPFYSGRQAGRGLGFGLCKCWRIIDQHSGHIEIESSPHGPTVVKIRWPLAQVES